MYTASCVWDVRDLNPQPTDYESAALTVELTSQRCFSGRFCKRFGKNGRKVTRSGTILQILLHQKLILSYLTWVLRWKFLLLGFLSNRHLRQYCIRRNPLS